MAQEVDQLSASETAVRFLPMGAGGFITSLVCGRAVEKVNGKILLLLGMGLSVLAPVPSCLTADKMNLYVLSPLTLEAPSKHNADHLAGQTSSLPP